VIVLRGGYHSDLAKLVASHLESNMSINRETNLANEGLDSLLCIELANDINQEFGASIDMGLLDGDLTYGDLLDMVTSHCQPLMPLVKAKVASTMPGPAPGIEISTNDPPTQAEEAPMGRAQQAFENIRFDYDVFTKETGFAGFWKTVYPTQARLVLAYTVEAFATLG
jgi:acyl carrier protein